MQLRARVGMVFQKPNPFPKSIYENVAYGPRIHGLAKSKTELDEIVDHQPEAGGPVRGGQGPARRSRHRLSGGQQQRLCIARAIAVGPEVILMDEPCSALDPIATAKIEELMDELRENFTIIIVTHSMQQAARVSQRTAFFHLGCWSRKAPTRRSSQRRGQAHAGLHHRPLRLTAARPATDQGHGNDRTYRQGLRHRLQELTRMVAEMGGLAEKQIADAVDALCKRDADSRAADRGRRIPASMRCSGRSRKEPS